MPKLRFLRFELLVSLGCIALLGYFAWHAWHGPRGWNYAARLQLELATHEAELSQLQEQKAKLEAKVKLIRPESVDADVLDELARSELGWVGRDDLVIRLQ
jgi:cell division protein FtsB